jgi:hypothetical protein
MLPFIHNQTDASLHPQPNRCFPSSTTKQMLPFIHEQMLPFIHEQMLPFIHEQMLPFIHEQMLPFIHEQMLQSKCCAVCDCGSSVVPCLSLLLPPTRPCLPLTSFVSQPQRGGNVLLPYVSRMFGSNHMCPPWHPILEYSKNVDIEGVL